jgi:hypothetical protein
VGDRIRSHHELETIEAREQVLRDILVPELRELQFHVTLLLPFGPQVV